MVDQMDATTAFLHGDIDADIYMTQPPGIHNVDELDHVCKLRKSINGIKQFTLC